MLLPESFPAQPRAQGHYQVKCHADTGEVLESGAAPGLLRIDNCDRIGIRRLNQMVIRDDHIDAGSASSGNRFAVIRAAVCRDDKIDARGHSLFLNMMGFKAIAFSASIRDMIDCVGAGCPEKFNENRCSRHPVDVIVTENQDFLSGLQGCRNSFNR